MLVGTKYDNADTGFLELYVRDQIRLW